MWSDSRWSESTLSLSMQVIVALDSLCYGVAYAGQEIFGG